jgi:adenine-specific DNA methylase
MARPTRLAAALDRYPTIQVSRLALREGNSKRPVYTMHKWWARRLGAVFRMILLSERRRVDQSNEQDLWDRFYAPSEVPSGFTVLDPFLGGGTTLIEASKQGASCIGVDIDPVACFITEMELTPIDAGRVQARYEEIDAKLREELGHFYRTSRGARRVDVVHFFWVDVVTCPTCRRKTDAHPTYQLLHDTESRQQTVVCPRCDAIRTLPLRARWNKCKCGCETDLHAPPVAMGAFTCPSCRSKSPIAGLSAEGMICPRMFAVEYLTQSGERNFQSATHRDRARYQRARDKLRSLENELAIPKARIPVAGRSDRRPVLFGFRSYRDLFNARQLLGLGLIAREIKATKDRDIRCALALAFSHSLATNNMFCGWAFGYRRLTPLFGVHAFRKVTRPVEGNLLGLPIGRGSFANTVRAVVRGYEYMAAPFEYRYGSSRPSRVDVALKSAGSLDTNRHRSRPRLLHRSSTDLSPLADRSVNLVLTDPPYFDNLSYSELSDFYHVWLRLLLGNDYVGADQAHTPIGGSLFGGRRRGLKRTLDPKKRYIKTLSKVLTECRRVVRTDGALVFTFHHKSADAWEGLGTSLLSAGFQIEEVVPVRSEGRSGFHSYEGTIKWDTIFFCRPHKPPAASAVDLRAISDSTQRALAVAKEWSTRIRRSRFEFSEADRASLAMSLVLCEFSRRGLPTGQLGRSLQRVEETLHVEPSLSTEEIEEPD